MVASARVAYLARRGTEYGVDAGNIHVDMERVRWRKRDIVDRFRNSGTWRNPARLASPLQADPPAAHGLLESRLAPQTGSP